MRNKLIMNFMEYDFMRNGFLAILLIAPLFGILGTMIVNNKLAFFSDALGHSAFTGVAIGVLLHIADTNLTMAVFAIIFALLLNAIKRKDSLSTDTIISVFSSFSTAIGFNRLEAASLNVSLAKSKGVPVTTIESIFAVFIALIVMFSIKWVGILLINALLILPAASARNIAGNMREYHLFSILISLFSGLLGLVLSYFLNTATGPTIVIIAAVFFFLTLLAHPLVKN